MQSHEFLPVLTDTSQIKVLEDPYLKVNINAVDHDNLNEYFFNYWDKTQIVASEAYNGRTFVGLPSNSSATSVDFTKTINLPSGHYKIEILAIYGPTYGGTIKLYDGSNLIEGVKSTSQSWKSRGRIIYRSRYFSGGNHTFKLTCSKNAFVESIKIYKINKYEGNSDDLGIKSSERLDLSNVEFTQNSVNEINALKMKLGMHEDYFNTSNSYSPIVFTPLVDECTVWLGEKRKEATAMFGGYITGFNMGDTLELRGVDRLLDLMRQPIYHNFSIGKAPASNDVNTLPYVEFPSVYELSRYLGITADYKLNTSTIPYDYGFNINFGDSGQYNDVSVSVWEKEYDLNFGQPKPCMKLRLGSLTGSAEAVLFNSVDTWNAAEYSMLHFHYYAARPDPRLEFNVKVRMHRKDQTILDAIDYIIHFTGPGNQSNVIGSVEPKLNGTFQSFLFNLKTAFDKYAPSSEYNISKISLVGNVSSSDLQTGRCRTIWIDNILSYKEINSAPKYESQNVKTHFEELQHLCDKTNHVAYVRPGEERHNDCLVVLPQGLYVQPESIEEGRNLIEVSEVSCNPLEDDFTNQRHINFNFANNTSGSAYYENKDSELHYRLFQRHSLESDINNQTDADTLAKYFVDDHSSPKLAFSTTILGSTILEPLQYAIVSVKGKRLHGAHVIRSITHTYDNSSSNVFRTKIDFNKPSRQFRNFAKYVRQDLRNFNVRNSRNVFNAYGLNKIGNSSPGAFM